MKISDVAVVGAGLSGLVCGSILSRTGLNVTLFDKGRFPGGRLASRDRDQNTFDYGAQYFTAKEPQFRQFLMRLVRSGKVARWSGKFGRFVNGRVSGESLSRPRYVGVPLMRSLVDELANSLDCRMSHRLKAVSRESGKWLLTGTVEDEHEESTFSCGDYDFLVLNMPPAQAAALRPFAGLSELILRPCVALLLAFQDRVSLDFDGVILEDRILSWVARDSSKPGRNPGERWVIHASPDWSEEYLQKPEDEVERLLTERFATVFGITLPPISFRKLHKWRFALPVSPPAWGSILDREAGLAYCGDWCVAARVEGAYLSGLHAAEQIIGAQSS